MKEIKNRTDFFRSLTETEQDAGYMKFRIPNDGTQDERITGEGIWGWLKPEDYKKWEDDAFYGELPCILCNDPIFYADKLRVYDEVVIKCNGNCRPDLSERFIEEYLR